jgi:hypothetical protein
MSTIVFAGLVALLAFIALPAAAEPTEGSAGVLPAHGPTAPRLALAGLHRETEAELRELVAHLPGDMQERLTGLYVAFDDTPADLGALAACDDDGDPVVVVTDALLVLTDHVGWGAAVDESVLSSAACRGEVCTKNSSRLDAYASLLARTPRGAPRLLPPPPGFFDRSAEGAPPMERVGEIRAQAISGLVARELAHHILGHLACPHPTPTRELGDDVWTASERARALAAASWLHAPVRSVVAVAVAVKLMRDSGRAEDGWLALSRVLGRVSPPPPHSMALQGGGVRFERVSR